MSLMSSIADALKNVSWKSQTQLASYEKVRQGLKELRIPMWEELETLLTPVTQDQAKDYEERNRTCDHIWGVVASINQIIDGHYQLLRVNEYNVDNMAERLLNTIQEFCLTDAIGSVHLAPTGLQFAKDFLRVAALYHDIGKSITHDRHVSRGVHLMRDVDASTRRSFESDLLASEFADKHNFWTLLSHHDTFGVLCTGEASLAALSQMVSWSGDPDPRNTHRSPAALVSYLVLLNLADGASSLRFGRAPQKELRTLEVRRYLDDWNFVKSKLWVEGEHPFPAKISREGFVKALLDHASHPEQTIERITRIITTCYRMEITREKTDDLLANESEVRKMVEEELDTLHGAKFQRFCHLFARFCKIDYGLRFFRVMMLHEALNTQHQLLERNDSSVAQKGTPKDRKNKPSLASSVDGYPYKGARRLDFAPERRTQCLQEMTRLICSVLKRFVDDYGDSVKGDGSAAPLMCIVMANLMPESNPRTAWAICDALKKHDSRALTWISEEVAVSPYGG